MTAASDAILLFQKWISLLGPGSYRSWEALGFVDKKLSNCWHHRPSSDSNSVKFPESEAMASKNAIVSSNRGGLPELNLNNKTGFTCDYNDIDSYVNALDKLISNEKLLEKFKENSYNRAKKFNINDIVPMYEYEYMKLVK